MDYPTKMTERISDVLIIGGGVIGLSIMRELLQYKLTVTLLERHEDVCNGVSKANSGVIHAGFADSHGSIAAKFTPSASQQFEQLDKELRFGYRKIGSLVIARDSAELAILHDLLKNAEKNGVLGLSLIDKASLYEREPRLAGGFIGALSAKESGIVSPYEFGIALAENCIENDGHIHLGQAVENIESQGSTFNVHTATGSYKTRLLINAGGLYADHISSLLEVSDAIINPRKGSYIVFNRGTGDLINHVLFPVPTKRGKGILVTPTFHGNLMIGPTAVDGVSKNDLSTTEEEIQILIAAAQKTITKLPLNLAITTFAGVRPRSHTGSFHLSESRDRFFVCSGIASPGLTAAPMIAKHVRKTFVAKHLQLEENDAFNPFREPYASSQVMREFLSAKVAAQEAKRPLSDPECMVCRCEQVRRKTIDAALGAGLPIANTDALKRRTRAGQGFCQGKFCRPRVAQIIAEYNHRAPDQESIPTGDGLEPVKQRIPIQDIRNRHQ